MIYAYQQVEQMSSIERSEPPSYGKKEDWDDMHPENRSIFIGKLKTPGSKAFMEVSPDDATELGILDPNNQWHRLFMFACDNRKFEVDPCVCIRAPEEGQVGPQIFLSIILFDDPLSTSLPITGVDVDTVFGKLLRSSD